MPVPDRWLRPRAVPGKDHWQIAYPVFRIRLALQHNPSRIWEQPGRLPLLVLILGLAATVIVTAALARSARIRERELFLNAARRTVANIESRSDTYISMLRGGAGLVTAQPEVTLHEFRLFTRRLRVDELYPGMQGVGYCRLVPVDEVIAFEARQRADGRDTYRIWPDFPREVYTTIVYLEPVDARNAAAIGYDMYTDEVRRAAMDRARDTGRPAASGIVELVQEIGPEVQPGFLIYVPVYNGGEVPPSLVQRRERLSGFIYAPFRAGDLFSGIFIQGLPQVSFQIYDGPEPRPERLLFQTPVIEGHRPRFDKTEHVSIAGRQWTITFASTPEGEAAAETLVLPLAMASGILLSLLLAGVMQVQRKAQLERERMLESERAAREESERVGRMKDEFLATLSHELRTPLTAMLGWAELLRSSELSEEEFNTGLEVIQRNAETQAQLINDLLDMSRIISGKIRLDPTPTDLRAIVTAAIEVVEPMANARNVQIKQRVTGNPAPLNVDPHRMQQVVWNLLTNAVKFSNTGGQIDVTLAYGPEVQIAVRDRGQGIAKDFLPYVFDRFRQADSSSTRRHMGLGLGLSIVKSLVELHGGRVSAESDGLGKGTLVRVCLPGHVPEGRSGHPGAAAAPSEAPAVAGSFASLAGVDVLLVEDERDSRELIVSILRSRGASVRATSSAQEAFAYLQDELPALLVSDIGMPGMDGYEFIRRVRNLPRDAVANVPAIALTAFARPQDRQKALEAGFQLHVAKPVTPAALIQACSTLLAKAAQAERE